MSNLKTDFDNLVNVLKARKLYSENDEVDTALNILLGSIQDKEEYQESVRTDKENIIDLIQNVFVNWGEFNISDVESADAPIYNELGNHIELIESFNNNSVTIFKYENDIEVDEFELDYEDLSMDLLEEILLIAEQYDVEQQKFFDSCLNKNF